MLVAAWRHREGLMPGEEKNALRPGTTTETNYVREGIDAAPLKHHRHAGYLQTKKTWQFRPGFTYFRRRES